MSPSIQRRQFLQGATASGIAAAAGGCASTPSTVDGRIVVPFWFSYGGRNREVLEKLVARFNTGPHGAYVHATFQGDYFEALAKLRTAIAAKAAPVISHVVGEVIPYLDSAGVLEPLDSFPGVGDLGLVPALSQAGTFVGGAERPLVALPFNRSTPILYMNGDLLDHAEIRPPTTWDELVQAARRLTRKDTSGRTSTWGFECPISWWFWVALVGQAGGAVFRDNGFPDLGGPAGVESVELWQRMVHELGCMRPPPGRDYNAWEVTNQDFLAQRAAMVFTSTAFLRYLEDHARFPVRAAPLPAFRRRSVPTGGTFFVLVRGHSPPLRHAAWEFLRWMMLPEQTIAWSTGTGYMPVAQAAVDQLEKQGYYERHPNDRVAMTQLAFAQPWPWSQSLFRIQREIVEPRLEQAVLGPLNAADVLRIAREEALHE